MEMKPHLSLANSMTLPGRTLAVIYMNNNLNPEQSGHLYEMKPNYLLTNKYPNLCILPMKHNVDLHKNENVPFVVINLLMDSIYLSKGEIMGFMQSQSLDISDIITETSTESSPILLEEDNYTEGSKEQQEETIFEHSKKKFITFPADFDVHRKVDLQGVEVTKEQQKAFQELCNE